MKTSKLFLTTICASSVLVVLAVSAGAAGADGKGPAQVRIQKSGEQFQLLVDGKPFYIKGAGLEFGSPEKLAIHGGNSFRTWRTENGRDSGQVVLDRALKNGLLVAMGLEVARERHGFDYNDASAVARQLEELKKEVLKYKDHPALLMWVIGNELNLNARNPKVWNAVEEISRMIHQLDPNHPTLTALAGFGKDLARQLTERAPSLDAIGIQMYADIANLPRYLRESGWTGPYIVTEWGATGHWEVPKTTWDAPIENDSTTKAKLYRQRFETIIATDTRQCLGSYVFLWEQKQERTPTWYGLFLESGEETAAVDVMHYLWNQRWPANQCPEIQELSLDSRLARDNVRLQSGQSYSARIVARDPDNDTLTYSWYIMEESRATSTGGDHEQTPRTLPGLIENQHQSAIQLRAPSSSGAYRLFAYVYDRHGHAAHANIPFYVNAQSAQSATLLNAEATP